MAPVHQNPHKHVVHIMGTPRFSRPPRTHLPLPARDLSSFNQDSTGGGNSKQNCLLARLKSAPIRFVSSGPEYKFIKRTIISRRCGSSFESATIKSNQGLSGSHPIIILYPRAEINYQSLPSSAITPIGTVTTYYPRS